MKNLSKLALLLLFTVAIVFAQLDTIPPHVVSTNPLNGATGVDPYMPVIFGIADNPGGSGVDIATIVMVYVHGTDTIIVDPTIVASGSFAGWNVTFEHPDPFVSGSSYIFGIHFSDNQGNPQLAQISFEISGSTYDDICAPMIVEFTDTHTCLPADGDIVIQLTDPMGPDCPDPSDIDPTTIHFWIDGVDHTAECSIVPAGYHDFMVTWDDPMEFVAGSEVEIGIDCSDNAGNSIETALHYHICETTPVDHCPPYVAAWSPDSCVIPTGPIGIFIDDPHSDLCPVTSGVDLYSIHVTVDGTDVTPGLYIIPEGPYGRYVEWGHPGAALTPGHEYTVCVHAADLAGHILDTCWIYDVCDDAPALDSCPPVAEWVIEPGSRCIEPDEVIGVFLADADEACEEHSGINPTTIHFFAEDVSGTWHDVTSDCEIFNIPGTVGHYQVNYSHETSAFIPGTWIGFCVDVADYEGNLLHDFCTEYEVCSDVVDDCPPEIIEWMPEISECIPPGGEVAIHMVDPFDGECYASNIDPSTVEVTVNGVDVTDGCLFTPTGEHHLWVDWHAPVVPTATNYRVCIAAADYAGLWLEQCHTYTACEDTTTPTDICAPVIVELTDTTHCIEHDADIVIQLADPMNPDCPDPSDIDPSTINFWIDGVNHTDECSITPAGAHGYIVRWDDPMTFVPGSVVEIGIDCSDNAGNAMEVPLHYEICGGTADECPPEVVVWYPETLDCITPDSYIALLLSDIAAPPCIASGIDLESIELSIGDAIIPSEDIVLDPMGDFEVHVGWRHDPLPPGVTFELCITFADLAGHSVTECHNYVICDTVDVPDDCPPRIDWAESADACLPSEMPIGVYFIDDSRECTHHSGIDSESIEFWVNGIDHTEWATIDEIPGVPGAWGLLWEHDPIAPDETLHVCVGVADMVGNDAEDCIDYIICEETPVDECPPLVVGWHPDTLDCIGPESPIGLLIRDNDTPPCIASGIDLESIELSIGDMAVPREFVAIDPMMETDVYVAWLHDPLLYGESYELCISFEDNVGHHISECHTYIVCPEDTTAPPDSTDDCPPEVVEWYPEYERCIGAESIIGLMVTDITAPPCIASGIDLESIEMHYGDIVIPGDDILIDPMGGFDVYIGWAHEPLVPGETYELCVSFADIAGHEVIECHTYVVCEDTIAPPDTIDECPPEVIAMHPAVDYCVEPTVDVVFHIADIMSTECYASGIDMESIVLHEADRLIPAEDVSVTSVPGSIGLWVEWVHEDLIRGETYEICITFADIAGHTVTECNYLEICTETPPDSTDDCPPVVVEWYPEHCVDIMEAFGVVLTDPISPECPFATGINIDRLRVYLNDEDITSSRETIIAPEGDLGARVQVMTDMIPGYDYNLCVVGYDRAGNEFEYCHEFYPCDTIPVDTVDVVAPCLEMSWPEDGDEVAPAFIEREGVCMLLSDACDMGALISGVDGTTIEVSVAGIVYGPDSPHIEIASREDIGGYLVCFHDTSWSPGEYEVCISATDHAGNPMEDCFSFTVLEPIEDTAPPCVEDTWPEDGAEIDIEVISREGGFCFTLTDLCEGDVEASGINTESIIITLAGIEIPHTAYSWYPMPEIAGGMVCTVLDGWEAGEYEACIAFEDNAGHAVTYCFTFTVTGEAPEDITPPCIIDTWPEDGDFVDIYTITHEGFCFWLSDVCEPGVYSSGIDHESIIISLDGIEIPAEHVIIRPAPEIGGVTACVEDLEGWEIGSYEACIYAMDNADHEVEYCFDFEVTGGDTTHTDTIPPCYTWSFSPHDTLISEMTVGIDICDVCGPGYSIGVDSSRAATTIIITGMGVTYTITDYTQEYNRCMGYNLDFELPALEPGEYTICIEARDYAGNVSEECQPFYIVAYDPPEDIWPPCGEWLFDDGDTLAAGSTIGIELCDICDDEATVFSGVDERSIVVTISLCDGSDVDTLPEDSYEVIPNYCHGVGIFSILPADHPDGCYTLCVYAADRAGNEFEECHSFVIGSEVPPIDTIPPCVVATWPPEDGEVDLSVIEREGGFCFTLSDICYWEEGATGIDPEMIRITLDGEEVPHTAYSWYSRPEIAGGQVCTVLDGWEIGEYEACITFSDMAGHSVTYCLSFTVVDESPVEDTFPPCAEWSFEDGDTVTSPFEINIAICDLCDPTHHEASGVERRSLGLFFGPCGTTPEPIEDFDIHEIDCMGYAIHHTVSIEPLGCYQVCVHANDLAGNDYEECRSFIFGHTEYVAEIISPEPEARISCLDYELAFIIEGEIPTSFEFSVDYEPVTLRDEGIRASGDTTFYAPIGGWTPGWHRVLIGTEFRSFLMDNIGPRIDLVSPDYHTPIPSDLEMIAVRIYDLYSHTDEPAIDEGSIMIMLGGGSFAISDPGVSFDPVTGILELELETMGITLTPGGTLGLTVMASDIVDICDPNYSDASWTFTIMTDAPMRRYLAGYVVDEETDDPIEGMIVNIGNYVTHESPFYPVAGAVTDADGYFVIEVRYFGTYIAEAFDDAMPPEYSPEFWNEQTCHLLADPIALDATAPETTFVEFTLSPYSEMTYFSVTGTIGIVGDGPLVGARVVAISSDEDDEEWFYDVTDGDGIFELLLPEGTYYILAHSTGFIPGYYGSGSRWEEDAELIEVTGDVDGIDIDLPPAAPDSGRFGMHITVFEEDTVGMLLDGSPVRGAFVEVKEAATNSGSSRITDLDGVASFYDLTEGDYSIIVDRHPFEMATGPYTVELPPSDIDVTVYMRRLDAITTDIDVSIPEALDFSVYPNPFNSAATMEFTIDEASIVQVDLYDASGRIVYSLPESQYSAGNHTVKINANGLNSGVYFCTIRLSGTDANASQKVILIK